MKLSFTAVLMGAVVAIGSVCCVAADKPAEGKKKLLFYSQSCGFRHSVVARPLTGEPAFAEKMLKQIAGQAGYEVYVSQDSNDLNDLKRFDAIILYTTGNPLYRPNQRQAFLKWLRNGGALIGIHTATDSFHSTEQGETPYDGDKTAKYIVPDWPEYTRIIGAAFLTHGPKHDPIAIKVMDPDNPATKHLGAEWVIGDEIYLFRNFNDKVHVLLTTDTEKTSAASLKGHKMERGQQYPIAWTNTEGKGRIFYTSLGHDEAVWENPAYQKHLLGGIAWALRQAEAK